ncbi:MAG: bifunctional DNA-formamidopyrimidine glycosylase/DNA-(apurinic or apyrimidinic site) lyase [Actinomycetota bacterium]
MPELPEVEVIRRDLEKEFVGRRIRSVVVRDTKNAMRILRRYGCRELEEVVAGAHITRVARKGKYLLLHLERERVLVVHLGMSGQLLRMTGSEPFANHTHVVLEFCQADQLRFVDPRSFGEIFVTGKGELGEVSELAKLGLDPLEQPDGWQDLSRLLAKRKTALKPLLMDQSFVCGIGNIYSDEILFTARLAPDRASNSLSSGEACRLWQAIQDVLQEAIRHRGTSIEDEQYRDLYGGPGEYRQRLRVYQRAGQPCLRCGIPIQRRRWSNRSVHFCPRCQV